MNSHLESIPSLRSFTTRGLAGSDLESLGWETNRALDAEILGLGTFNELLADLLESSDLAAGQGDTDLVSFLRGGRMLVKLASGSRHECKHTGPSPNSFSGFW